MDSTNQDSANHHPDTIRKIDGDLRLFQERFFDSPNIREQPGYSPAFYAYPIQRCFLYVIEELLTLLENSIPNPGTRVSRPFEEIPPPSPLYWQEDPNRMEAFRIITNHIRKDLRIKAFLAVSRS